MPVRLFLTMARFSSWLPRLNSRWLTKWIIKRNKERLYFLIYTSLDNELCNFALFKSYRTVGQTNTLRDCSCRYFEKKSTGILETNDIGPFRSKKSISFVPILQQSVCLLVFILVVRCWTNVVM